MNYRKLGRTEMEVSTVCLGCWALIGGPTWGEQDPDQSLATVEAALDAGINFFDTAPAYGDGRSEALLGEVLPAVRKDVIIATKISGGDLAPGPLRKSCERSLRLLRTDHVDLLQLHWPNPHVPLAETYAAMRRLQEEGKVRTLGVSNFGAEYLQELLAVGPVETNQVAYSLLWRAIEFEVKPICEEQGVGILCYSPLCQGLLTGKYATGDDVPEGRARTRLFSQDRPESRHHEPGCEAETFRAIAAIRGIAADVRQPMGDVALAWLLAQKSVTAVIAGARTPDQVRQNARAAELRLAGDVVEALAEATEKIKQHVGPNADMWQTDSRMDKPR